MLTPQRGQKGRVSGAGGLFTFGVCHPSPEGVVGVSDALGVDTRGRSAGSELTGVSVGFEEFRLLLFELRFGQYP